MPAMLYVALGGSLAIIGGAFFLVGGHHEIAWRIRQRRRRHAPLEFGRTRL